MQLADMVGTSVPYINRVIKKTDGLLNKTFVNMMDQLGCDIEMRGMDTLRGDLGFDFCAREL